MSSIETTGSVKLTGAAVEKLFGNEVEREQFLAAKQGRRGTMLTAALHKVLGLKPPMSEAQLRTANKQIDDLLAQGVITAEQAEAMRPGAELADDTDSTSDADSAADSAADSVSEDGAVTGDPVDPELDGPEAKTSL